MDMQDLVSIIVPIYKVEQYLERCIESIVNQTYKNIEIVLVDDGSPDQCPKICDEWAKKDSRIKVIHKQNGGLSDARNAGMEMVNGTYVSFIDSDDYVHPQFIEVLYCMIKENQADMAACEYEEVEETSKLTNVKCISPEYVHLKNLHEITPSTIGVTAWNKLYKKDLIDRIRFPEGKIYEDVGIWWTVTYYAKKIVATSERLYYYCNNPKSIIRKKYTMKHMDLVDVLYMQYKKFREISQYVYAEKILNECLNSFPGIYIHLKKVGDFRKGNRKIFLEKYWEMIQVAEKETELKSGVLLKHKIYSKMPIVMWIIYNIRR